jgi:iron(II)-dependent oxidoreductase
VTLRSLVAAELEAVRGRTLDLLAPLADDDLRRQHSPIMSPLVWDLAHVGNYEELWLVRAVADAAALDPALDDIYDAFRHHRSSRPALPLLGPAAARSYLAQVRGRALDALERTDVDDAAGGRLVGAGFVYGMVIQHEHQHDETMLATLQLMDGRGYRPVSAPSPAPVPPPEPPEITVAAGPFLMGTDGEPWAYDNERPSHVVDLPAFRVDTAPVTNRQYLEFVDDGGYHEPRWWTEAGWAWRRTEGVEHPQFWSPEGDGSWSRLRFGWREDLPPDEPVQHVCWYEADAYARWAGRRLPTEAEWEKAASWTPDGRKLRHPWGDEWVPGVRGPNAEESRANLGQVRFGPDPVGSHPHGVSPWGCHQMLGDVWEWTSSDFEPYPGFGSFPYREYSEVFFASGYKVLRGGSWATSPLAVRTTFRNWDLPVRRQIFAGFRCASDA